MQACINKWGRRKIFLIVKCQLINVDRMVDFEKLLFSNHSSKPFSQKTSKGAKTSGQKLVDKWDSSKNHSIKIILCKV